MKKTAAGKSSTAPKNAVSTEKRTVPTVNKSISEKKPVSATKAKKTSESDKKAIGDKRLTAAELVNFKEKLLVVRARLRGDVLTMAEVALNKNRMDASGDVSTMPIHMADIGSDNFEQEQTLSFMQSEHGLLEMVDEALKRIKEERYGICEDCECQIPKARLNAILYAAKCVTCAASDEHDH